MSNSVSPRRKRGLSLRTQLFQSNSSNCNPTPIELQTLPPQITVDKALPTPHTTITHNDHNPKSLSHSSIYNTYERLASASSSMEFLPASESEPKSRGRLRYSQAHPWLFKLNKLKNRFTGNDTLPASRKGRVIPLSFLSCSQANEYFDRDLYDEHIQQLIDERSDEPYCSNSITSSKYSLYSFFPKQLRAQFSKIANCYFLVVAIMQMIPSWSTTGQYTTIIPLLIFISISMAREGFDDWKRHVHDKEENNKSCLTIKSNDDLVTRYDAYSVSSTILTQTLDLETTAVDHDENYSCHNPKVLSKYNLQECKTKWKDIKVGDIVKIREDEWVPADIIVLSADNDNEAGAAYVETMALDGETNLKLKSAPTNISNLVCQARGLRSINELITVEDPNIDLYNFEGTMNFNGDPLALGPDNVVYRGSILRNTKSLIGIVFFTGEETKIRMNNIKNPRTKAPKLQRNINFIVIFMIFVVALLSAFSTMGEKLYLAKTLNNNWYLFNQDVGTAPTLMSFIIMYNTLIPLSLYVTMEIIKVGQLLLLQCDIDMYHVDSNTPADAKTATILEELGQVGYIFSDKTGTLTDNLMLFRKFSVNGVSWLHDPDSSSKSEPMAEEIGSSPEIKSIKSATSWKSTAHPNRPQDSKSSLELLKYIQENPNTLFSKKAKFFLLSLALCSTCLPRRKPKRSSNESIDSLEEGDIDNNNNNDQDNDITFQAASPDEKALVEAARDLGYVIFDKKNTFLTIKTYPKGFKNPPKFEHYEVLDVVEFSSTRKRMSIIVKFPDNRICVICKGADNVIIEKLKQHELAKRKAKEISLNAVERKNLEADILLQERFSHEAEMASARGSLSSLRSSFQTTRGNHDRLETMQHIDNYLMGNDEAEVDEIASQARISLHLQQAQRYSLDSHNGDGVYKGNTIPNDKLLVVDEFIIEKTLEHIEEFSTEGLRTLLYGFKWVDKKDYDSWHEKYQESKTALTNRSQQIEEVGGIIEHDFELLGASAIEDKLQEGVSDTIDKLRRAGIRMWMLTGDKRETAINIGHSCRLIKDYSTVTILDIDHGIDTVETTIRDTTRKVNGGSIAHCVVVIDGATFGVIEKDNSLMKEFVGLCIISDSAICCRASPSQKAHMVSSIRDDNKRSVTLAIGDGANDIAMIQSADIGVGITGKEGLQAARASDYAIAQFRFLLKLLLVNGRYNYVRTAKFVLCTFYKELIFYLTQCLYQRHTLFTGSSVFENWSLSMFNTLFTSLCVLVIGIFDRDLKPATLLAVPELYAIGREYKAFNLKVFISWMLLAALQSVGVSFIAWHGWGLTALRDNTTLPLGTLLFASLIIIINAKCEFIEMQNRNWLAFAAFLISILGYGLWNVLIMMLYRSGPSKIYFADYGLFNFGQDQSWWAALLAIPVVALLFDIILKLIKFMIFPSDDEIFKEYEKDIGLRRQFEERSFPYLQQGWTMPQQSSIWRRRLIQGINYVRKHMSMELIPQETNDDTIGVDPGSAVHRKRAGTNTSPNELPPGTEASVIQHNDFLDPNFEVLPSGKQVKIKRHKKWSLFNKNNDNDSNEDDSDIEAIISERIKNSRE